MALVEIGAKGAPLALSGLFEDLMSLKGTRDEEKKA